MSRSPCGDMAFARCHNRSCCPTVVAGSQTPGSTAGYRSAYSGRSRASRMVCCTEPPSLSDLVTRRVYCWPINGRSNRPTRKGEVIRDSPRNLGVAAEPVRGSEELRRPYPILIYAASLSDLRRRSQVVRQRSAKPPFVGSIPTGASGTLPSQLLSVVCLLQVSYVNLVHLKHCLHDPVCFLSIFVLQHFAQRRRNDLPRQTIFVS